ncbi:MAG TPA: glycosyltransferase, partial [Thermoanaerobaculia bacterium]
RFPGEVADKVRVIHVGIDPEVYRRLPAPASDPPKILCVASLRPYKGVPVLLEACRRLLDEGMTFHCEIVGEGPLRPELERRIAGLGLAGAVSLLGALPQHEVTRRLGESAVFVLPSIVAPDGQMEGIPVALMEAMAAGRPVVTSALSGIPELVEDGMSGVLVQPGDAPGIAAALKRLLEDPALRLRMGERGREKVDAEFRLDGTVAGLTALIDQHAEPADPEVVDLLRRAGLDGAGVRRVHRRMDSMVVEALAAGPQELILKIQRSRPGESRPPLERARHEFEVLSCLYQRFAGESGFGVPRPLRLAEEVSAVVMERCQGTALDEIVRRGRMARGAEWEGLLAALRRAGGWLRLFQRHTQAGHHGDFWPGNVYVDRKGGVQVIDFEGYREGLPWEDPAYFLVHLELFFAWPGLRRRFAKASAAFLDGYLEGDRLDRAALSHCLASKARQALARTDERRQRRALVSILRRAGAER